jgi:hypothetical protein
MVNRSGYFDHATLYARTTPAMLTNTPECQWQAITAHLLTTVTYETPLDSFLFCAKERTGASNCV